MDSFKKRVAMLREEMNAPKSKHNDFGNYNYRSCEDIFDGAKAILQKYSMNMLVSDEIVMIGDRFYIKATAKLVDFESDEEIVSYGYARESLDLPKMSQSQVTGTASSYARKYACGALLLIDDVKDADSNEFQNEIGAKKPETTSKAQPKKQYAKTPKAETPKTDKTYTADETGELRAKVFGYFTRHQLSDDAIKKICNLYQIENIEAMNAEQCSHYIATLTKNGGNIDE